MNLINPLGLLGLLSLPVIVWLHMHRDRSRQVIVSSLNLWSFLDVQLSGSISRKIRLSWLLIIDLLIALLVTFALARPEINSPAFLGSNVHTIILLDNTVSMRAAEDGAVRFDSALTDIRDLIEQGKSGDVITMLTFGGKANVLGDTRELEERELINRVENLIPPIIGADLHNAVALGLDLTDQGLPVEIHIFTDGAFEAPNLENIHDPVHWHLYGKGRENQAISAVRVAEISTGNYQVFTEFVNFSSFPISREAVLSIDGLEVDRLSLDMGADSSLSHFWHFSGNPKLIAVSLNGSDLLGEDDEVSVGIHADQKIQVALVADDPYPVDKAILSSGNVALYTFRTTDVWSAFDFDLIVFRGYLPDVWPIGNVLVLDPPVGNSLINSGMMKPLSTPLVVSNSDQFSDLDFSGVRWGSYVEISDWENQFSPVLMAGESPLFLQGGIDLSNISIFLPRLADGNLLKHPAFPLFISSVVNSAGEMRIPSHARVGDEMFISPNQKQPVINVIDPKGINISSSQSGEENFLLLEQPGIYQLEITDQHGEIETKLLGVNVTAIEESNLTPGSWTTNLETSSLAQDQDLEQVIDLRPWLLVLVLVLLLLEAYLSWRY